MLHPAARNTLSVPRHATRAHQQGVYALEFALTFFLFFLLLYAVLTYGLIFAAQQSLSRAAETGARSMLGWQANLQNRSDAARQKIRDAGWWLEQLGGANTIQIAICDKTGLLISTTSAPQCSSPNANQIKVVVLYPYAQAPLVPSLGPGVLSRWLVPESLSAEASVNLSVAYQGAASNDERP